MQLFVLALGIGGGLLAEDSAVPRREKVQISKTERLDFPAGGRLRLENSVGDLTIEAWDEPAVEITTIRLSRREHPVGDRARVTAELERVTVKAQQKGNELVVTTDYPRHRAFPPPSPVGEAGHFDLEYHIRVPRTARVSIDHDVGQVHIDGVAGDIEANVLGGDLLLHLPEDGVYNIDAKTDLGHVNSDFPGNERRRSWFVGHKVVSEPGQPARSLHLRVGLGDIVILKTRLPKIPASQAGSSSRGGQ